MKRNVEWINIGDAVLNKDFIVVSKMVMTYDYSLVPFKEEMDLSDVIHVSETPYPEKLIKFVYDVGQDIDIHLAVTLGLGVIKSTFNGEMFLYHMDPVEEDRQRNEMLRLGMYYQIMNPNYDDRQLDYLLETKGGEYYVRTLILGDSNWPIERLKEIFVAKKGSSDNIVVFKTEKKPR